MFRFFKRGQQATRVPRPAIIRLRAYIEVRERRLAGYLQQKLQRLSPRALTMYLMGFCITGSGICAYLLINALVPFHSVLPAIPVQSIRPPRALMMDTVFVYPDKPIKK